MGDMGQALPPSSVIARRSEEVTPQAWLTQSFWVSQQRKRAFLTSQLAQPALHRFCDDEAF